jgi:hypothetical protein
MQMVSQLNNRNPAREQGYEMMQYIAGRITAVSGGTAVTQKIGTIPSGAIITGIHSRVVTAYSTAASMAVVIGASSATPNDMASVLNTAAGGTFVQMLATQSQPLTADLDVWAQITSGATAGDSYISVWFEKPLA